MKSLQSGKLNNHGFISDLASADLCDLFTMGKCWDEKEIINEQSFEGCDIINV